jgi:arsenate reductase (thioredoxin)
MNRKGRETFTPLSAGSHPAGTVRPEAIRQIEKAGLNRPGARRKSWDVFPHGLAPPEIRVHGLRHTLLTKCVPSGPANR